MEKKKQNILIGIIIAAFVVALLAAGYLFVKLKEVKTDRDEMVELMTIEKEELEEQYEDLFVQFDGYQQLDIRNDSLQDLLSREQQRVQDLLEELRATKASNARKIAELKNELATVRAVTQDLIRQIDSLNVTNARLTEENILVRQENQQVKRENTQLTNQNTRLKETVSRASMLEISNLSMTMLNKNDKKTRMVSNMRKLQFDFEIAKNVTCTPGMKDLYARIIDPEGELVGESEEQLFKFENSQISYTLAQQFEYSGEVYEGACYYTFAEEEEVKKGYYTIDFFCDGNLIGSYPFMLKK